MVVAFGLFFTQHRHIILCHPMPLNVRHYSRRMGVNSPATPGASVVYTKRGTPQPKPPIYLIGIPFLPPSPTSTALDTRPRAELAPHGANKRLDRPSSARLGPSHRWNSGTPPGTVGGGFRQGGGGGRGRPKTRASNLPPSQQASLPVPPAALSATMGSLTEGARKVEVWVPCVYPLVVCVMPRARWNMECACTANYASARLSLT